MRDLKMMFDYNASTGVLRWKVKPPHSRTEVGDIAGQILRNGYRTVGVFGKRYKASRLCWFLHCGKWPRKEIDHINGVRADDRIENLREATRSQNQANASYEHSNTSGYRGVSRTSQGKWIAYISINGRNKCLGTYEKPEIASEAFRFASSIVRGEYSFAR